MAGVRSRLLLPTVLGILAAACGGDNMNTAVAPRPAPTSSGPVSSTSSTPSPLVVPNDCRPDGSALEISTLNTTWVGAGGHPLAPGEACLAASRGPFTVTVHNDVHGEGIGAPNHNFAVYTDSTASEELFRGDLVYTRQSMIYHVPEIPAGVYFFRCDVHPEVMNGVLVVK
jgi:hypothetical protein